MNPQICETLEWLKQQGLPPLPIAPAQDPEQFPGEESGRQPKDWPEWCAHSGLYRQESQLFRPSWSSSSDPAYPIPGPITECP